MTPRLTDEEHAELAEICRFYCKYFGGLPNEVPPTIRDRIAFAKAFIARCPVPIEENVPLKSKV